jgi:hypothetical protein
MYFDQRDPNKLMTLRWLASMHARVAFSGLASLIPSCRGTTAASAAAWVRATPGGDTVL